jgi:hypothetical protein
MTDWKDICALDEIEDGAIRAVEIEGEAWLVSRSGDASPPSREPAPMPARRSPRAPCRTAR